MAPGDALPDGLLDALTVCVARSGLAGTTLEDVAREAGCSRATLYRHFAGKVPLLAALAARDGETIARELVAEARVASTLTDAVVAVVAGGVTALGEHPALARLLAEEPEVLLPYLSFAGQTAFLAAAADRLAPAFTAFLPEPDAARLAEWVVRMTLSHLLCPSDRFDVADAAQVRSGVDAFVVPGFLHRSEVHQ
ncbi:MAG: TetR/AcrR family transcriptional regulator [Actinomycetota bacterium]